jgi:hypothetical protein
MNITTGYPIIIKLNNIIIKKNNDTNIIKLNHNSEEFSKLCLDYCYSQGVNGIKGAEYKYSYEFYDWQIFVNPNLKFDEPLNRIYILVNELKYCLITKYQTPFDKDEYY